MYYVSPCYNDPRYYRPSSDVDKEVRKITDSEISHFEESFAEWLVGYCTRDMSIKLGVDEDDVFDDLEGCYNRLSSDVKEGYAEDYSSYRHDSVIEEYEVEV